MTYESGTATATQRASGTSHVTGGGSVSSSGDAAVAPFATDEDFLRAIGGWRKIYHQSGSEPGSPRWIVRVDEFGSIYGDDELPAS